MTLLTGIVMSVVLLGGCGITPISYDDTMIDGPLVDDTSFTDPTFLLSTHPGLDTINKNTPVIICAHGYTGCTFEWEEFREFAREDGRVLTSLVLLGAHGRDIEDFEGSTWKEWQAPIMEEYDALVGKGFTHISLAGSSTGGTLLLDYLSSNAFSKKTVLPEEMFFIDPIVVPSSKLLHIINVVGPMLGNSPVERTTEIEKRHWYTNRPANTLAELNSLCEHIRGKLEHGILLPKNTNAKCYKSEIDDAVDPVSALMIYKGLHGADGGKVDVEIVASEYHVFTQLASRTDADRDDEKLQIRVFNEMTEKVVGH